MVENRGNMQMEPDPHFDGHVSKMANIDLASTSLLYAFEATQVRLQV